MHTINVYDIDTVTTYTGYIWGRNAGDNNGPSINGEGPVMWYTMLLTNGEIWNIPAYCYTAGEAKAYFVK